MDALEQGFQLDELRVDPLAGEVSGPGGRARLDRKVMDVLVFMARHAGHVVTREELHTALWPGAVVTDDAATRCFYELRRQLSRAGGHDRYRALVETLPKRGYRLNGYRRRPGDPRSPMLRSRRRKRRLPGLDDHRCGCRRRQSSPSPVGHPDCRHARGRTRRGREDHSIAVLPFLDMSAAKDQGYFSDGVTEEILNHLSQADEPARHFAHSSIRDA